MRSSLAIKPAPPADQSTLPAGQRPSPVPVDIRSAKPYPFARRSFRQLVLRFGSVTALAALVLTALFVGLFRASYDVVTRDLLRLFGVRRRAILAGEGDHLLHLYRTLGSDRSGIEYRFVGSVSRSGAPKGLASLGHVSELR